MLKFIILFFSVIYAGNLAAQDENNSSSIQKGNVTVSGGIGFLSWNKNGFPLFVSSAYMTEDYFGIGLYTGYDKFNETISSRDNLTNTVILEEKWIRRHYSVGLLGEFHVKIPAFKKLDPFIIAVAGFNFIDNELLNAGQKQSQTKTRETILFADLGVNYYVTESFGIQARFGYSKAPFFAGLIFKF